MQKDEGKVDKLINESQIEDQVANEPNTQFSQSDIDFTNSLASSSETNDTLDSEEGRKGKKKKKKADSHPVSKKANIIISSVVCALALGSGMGLGLYFGLPYLEKNEDFGSVKEEDIDELYAQYVGGQKDLASYKDYQLINIAYKIFEETPIHYSQIQDGWVKAPPANQVIRSTYARVNDSYFGEAISAGFVNIGKRWYQQGDGPIEHYATKSLIDDGKKGVWNSTPDVEYTKSEMKQKWGKSLQDGNIYVISEQTVLESSKTENADGNLEITLKLDPKKTVKNYVRQMDSMSDLGGKFPKFSRVDMKFTLTKDLQLIERHVYEDYVVIMLGKHVSESQLIEHYHVVDNADGLKIPSINEHCEY